MLTKPESLVDVSGLTISYRQGLGWNQVVEDVSFKVERGEVFGLVGESGCGKSTVALQLLGYRHAALRTDRGSISFDGQDVLRLARSELDRLRGAKVSFVPQNPTTALNPGMRVGAQIEEILTAHGHSDVAERTRMLFGLVGLPEDADFKRRFPHQLSGGQQQRVCIGMALACDPQFVVLDEPTTGLDVTTQEQIVELLIDLRARLSMSMLYVTHDLGLLSQLADRIGVMYAGRIVEVAPTAALFADPRHPYTRGLIGAIPRIDGRSELPARPLRGLLQRQSLPKGCPFAPRCDYALPKCFDEVQVLLSCGPRREAACWRLNDITPLAVNGEPKQAAVLREPQELLEVKNVTVVYGHGKRSFTALRDINLRVGKGETVALVGESGSGKSTLARAIAGLAVPAAGTVRLGSAVLAELVKRRTAEQRRLIQYVFQNPDASLNPRATVATSLARPFAFFYPDRAAQAPARVVAALSDVRLDARYAERYPDQLSGGERQRIAIARALMAEPELLLCDEILSALDVSVQANILALLLRLKREHAIAMLFISHDLAVVRMLADRIYVLFRGEVMEMGTRDQVFTAPFHPYTHALLEAVPAPLKARRPAAYRRTEASAVGAGCPYAGRCTWQIGPICESDAPPWRQTAEGLAIRCHYSLEELKRRAVWPHGPTKGK
ncbi:MAG: ABC transporter ATP-binding protein [Thermoflexales bacterium]